MTREEILWGGVTVEELYEGDIARNFKACAKCRHRIPRNETFIHIDSFGVVVEPLCLSCFNVLSTSRIATDAETAAIMKLPIATFNNEHEGRCGWAESCHNDPVGWQQGEGGGIRFSLCMAHIDGPYVLIDQAKLMESAERLSKIVPHPYADNPMNTAKMGHEKPQELTKFVEGSPNARWWYTDAKPEQVSALQNVKELKRWAPIATPWSNGWEDE